MFEIKQYLTAQIENIQLNGFKDQIYREEEGGKSKLDIINGALWLEHNTFLKNSKLSTVKNYLYIETKGFYVEISDEFYKYAIHLIALNANVKLLASQVSNLLEQMKLSLCYDPRNLESDTSKLSFNNGILDLNTGNFSEHNPMFFITSCLDFNYNKEANYHVCWDQYLESFTGNNPQKIKFIRSWFCLLIHSYPNTQTFLCVVGPGMTGKSVLGNVATLLTGEHRTVYSSVKSVNNNMFETSLFLNKSLLQMSDAEHYKGDLSILKALTGGDGIAARVKHTQGNFDYRFQGNILIVSNYTLATTDVSGGLSRRMRILPAENVISKPKLLINKKNNIWEGPLVKELPAIFNWVYESSLEDSTEFIRDPANNPGHSLMEMNNPLAIWAQESLCAGGQTQIGGHPKDPKTLNLCLRKRWLFAHYVSWCGYYGLTPMARNLFSEKLKSCCPYPFTKRKTNKATLIDGIQLKEEAVQGKDLLAAEESLIDDDEAVETQRSYLNEFPILHDEEIDKLHYDPYMQALEKTDLKFNLNKFMRSVTLDESKLLQIYKGSVFELSKDLEESVKEQISKGVEKVTGNLIQYNYRCTPTGARIFPVPGDKAINSVKRVVREEAYCVLSTFEGGAYSVLDLDLVSCFTNVACGLYPEDLMTLRLTIQKKGLWKHLEEFFNKKNVGQYWNKPAVKICVYSSFFFGGDKAMYNGIIDNFAKDAGMKTPEYKQTKDYLKTDVLATKIVRIMNNSDIISDFRALTKRLVDLHKGGYMVGPTGMKCDVRGEEDFIKAYPNFLQSYEFYILSKGFLKAQKEYPDAQLIGHFHDGKVVIIPKDQTDSFFQSYTKHVSDLEKELNLSYPMAMEIKTRMENGCLISLS